MKNNNKRALRRHHRNRLKRKRSAYCVNPALIVPEPSRSRWLGIYVSTIPACSCWMCGNPRRYFRERTVAERRFEASGNDGD